MQNITSITDLICQLSVFFQPRFRNRDMPVKQRPANSLDINISQLLEMPEYIFNFCSISIEMVIKLFNRNLSGGIIIGKIANFF